MVFLSFSSVVYRLDEIGHFIIILMILTCWEIQRSVMKLKTNSTFIFLMYFSVFFLCSLTFYILIQYNYKINLK
jgi:hypothetical protein